MFGGKIGIDLGTGSIQYCLHGADRIFSEPCIAAVDSFTGKVLACGGNALSVEGRMPPTMQLVHVMQDGVITNYALARYMISDIVNRICKSRILKPDITASISCGVTELDKKIMLDVLYDAGAGSAFLMEEPVAVAFGAGIAEEKPKGCAVLDVGGGTTDCAIVTMNSIAVSRSSSVAGNYMTKEIMRYLRDERGIEVGFATAEEMKKVLANAVMRTEEVSIVVGGKRLSGEGVNFEITTTEMRFVLKECYENIKDLVVSVFEETQPDLLGDIAEKGLLLSGGSAEIYGLDAYLSRSLHIPVHVPDDPSGCVIRGIRKSLSQTEKLAARGYLYTGERI